MIKMVKSVLLVTMIMSLNNLYQSAIYNKIKGYNITIFQAFKVDYCYSNKLKCLSACSIMSNCSLVLPDSNKRCILYSEKAAKFLKPGNNLDLFYKSGLSLSYYNRKTLNYNGLINYWPLNGLNDDLIGNAHLTSVGDKKPVLDPYGNTAVYMNKTFYQLPPGVYFNGSFSITSWFRIDNLVPHVRLFDCGNGKSSDNIVLSLAYISDLSIVFYLFTGSSYKFIRSSTYMPGVWYFLAVTFNGTHGTIYLNGNNVAQGLLNIPRNIRRATCYIGASNWLGDPNTEAYIGDFKIYNRCLSPTDVMSEFN